MGVERSRKAAEQAQIVVYLEEPIQNPSLKGEELESVKGTLIRVTNKSDLIDGVSLRGKTYGSRLLISAKNGEIEPLKQELVRLARASMQTQAVMLSNARHYEAVSRANEAIRRVQTGLADQLSGELLSLDLQDCLSALGEVTGQITNQEILNTIFSKFCIGK